MQAASPYQISGYRTIREGRASVYLPEASEVFYNPTQVFNRDCSTLVVTQYLRDRRAANPEAPPARLLDALAASGLRGLRYVREIPSDLLGEVISNDLSADAVLAMKRNAAEAGPAADRFTPLHSDALETLRNGSFDVIDLDPYGSPSIFLNDALKAAPDGALLCVTSTDLQILCTESQPDVCYQRYGAVPTLWKGTWETAVRIALGALAEAARPLRRTIKPLFSFYHNHYLRVFVTVGSRPCEALHTVSQVGSLTVCRRCGAAAAVPYARAVDHPNGKAVCYSCAVHSAFPATTALNGGVVGAGETSPGGRTVCGVCGTTPHTISNIWVAPIHDADFLKRLLATVTDDSLVPAVPGREGEMPETQPYAEDGRPYLVTRTQIHANVLLALDELTVMSSAGGAVVWDPSDVASVFAMSGLPRDTLCLALHDAGHAVSACHTLGAGFKTSASPLELFSLYASLMWAASPAEATRVVTSYFNEGLNTKRGLAVRMLTRPRPLAPAEAQTMAQALETVVAANNGRVQPWLVETVRRLPAAAVTDCPALTAARTVLDAALEPAAELPELATTLLTTVGTADRARLGHPYLLHKRRRPTGLPVLWAEKPAHFGPKTAAKKGASPDKE